MTPGRRIATLLLCAGSFGAAAAAGPGAAATANVAAPPVEAGSRQAREDSGTADSSAAGPLDTTPRSALESTAAVTPLGLEITDFRQREPGDGEPVSEATRAYVSYDENNLHVVFVCEDKRENIRANVVPRDRITGDDRVVVYLDTFDDNQRCYAFEANPLGIQRDGFLTEGQDDDYEFDALWHAEGRITPSGYVVRMRIPFGSLRFAKGSDRSWGIGLARYIERKSEKSYWPYVTDRVEGFVNQLGSARGLASISPGRRFQFVPYVVATRSRFLDGDSDIAAFRQTREERFGLDAKFVPHDAVTVDLAVRPDFSQVEPDAPQVTVNERFEKRVDEKRPFFLENAGYFVTPIELFFSRRIQYPSGGARVTSKVGAWAVGALVMDDREPGLVDRDDPLYGQRAYAGVVRLQREFRGQSTLGILASDRELGEGFNRVLSADARIKLGSNWVATGQFARTAFLDDETPRTDGSGGYGKIRRSGRFFDCSARYEVFTPGFQADLGFVPRVGYREVATDAEYTFRPRRSVVNSWGPKVGATVNWAWDGRVQDAEVEFGGSIELPADTQLEVTRSEVFELFEDQEFRLYMNQVVAETKWLKWLSVAASYQRGTEVNHDTPRKVQPFAASSQEADLSISLRPTSRLELKQEATYGWLRNTEMHPTLGTVIRPVYSNWVLQSKLKLQVNRELSVRAIANYEALIPNPALSDEDEERELLPDILITYLMNPWTALHVGYTERFQNVRIEDGEVVGEPATFREMQLPRTSVDRQFFVKASYLFRF